MRCTASEAVRGAGWGALSSVAVPFAVNGHWADLVQTLHPVMAGGNRHVFGTHGLHVAFFEGLLLLYDLPDKKVGSFDMMPMKTITADQLRGAMESDQRLTYEMFRAVADCLASIHGLVTRHPKTCGVDKNLWPRLQQWATHVHRVRGRQWHEYPCSSPIKKFKKMHFTPLAVIRIPLENVETGTLKTFTIPVHRACKASEVTPKGVKVALKALKKAPLNEVVGFLLKRRTINCVARRHPGFERGPFAFGDDHSNEVDHSNEDVGSFVNVFNNEHINNIPGFFNSHANIFNHPNVFVDYDENDFEN
ncbi:hypothetical protein GNI_077300 [Gregarina niphandrodes]|uniref:Uncharacterized protein n=1 Tax=Gregarina niphandrodes TaxID=110365 RepID=A0A023B6T9_GRENI|nr:hypothetical protein GNI_077300 [Gregarina niphandrodes]EZG66707.1 hypothetical protein GNI_077300 [Gregarina niphandrodes]|eukprot:XP_011130520.1 hypothetical protein GNI_077300 [Gregarina niphandrodes]